MQLLIEALTPSYDTDDYSISLNNMRGDSLCVLVKLRSPDIVMDFNFALLCFGLLYWQYLAGSLFLYFTVHEYYSPQHCPLERPEAETKWPPFSRRHFQTNFLEWKCTNFDYNFTEVCSWGSTEQYSSIGSDNGLAPARRQAIIWTNDG